MAVVWAAPQSNTKPLVRLFANLFQSLNSAFYNFFFILENQIIMWAFGSLKISKFGKSVILDQRANPN
jgi:hypothetical protein